MNERHDATTSNSSMHERIELLVSTIPRIANFRWLGVIRATRRSFDALPSQTHKRTHSAGGWDVNETRTC